MGYGGWIGGITGRRVAIELAANSMVFVMAREELGLRRRMLILLEAASGGGIVAVILVERVSEKEKKKMEKFSDAIKTKMKN